MMSLSLEASLGFGDASEKRPAHVAALLREAALAQLHRWKQEADSQLEMSMEQ